MVLINCSECGSKISDIASACIRCGCPIESSLQEKSQIQDLEVNVQIQYKTLHTKDASAADHESWMQIAAHLAVFPGSDEYQFLSTINLGLVGQGDFLNEQDTAILLSEVFDYQHLNKLFNGINRLEWNKRLVDALEEGYKASVSKMELMLTDNIDIEKNMKKSWAEAYSRIYDNSDKVISGILQNYFISNERWGSGKDNNKITYDAMGIEQCCDDPYVQGAENKHLLIVLFITVSVLLVCFLSQ